MGCHPKPIDFHSIIFQDGEIAPPTSNIHIIIFLYAVMIPNVVNQIYLHTHRIHGAAIYGNMDPINIPPLC